MKRAALLASSVCLFACGPTETRPIVAPPAPPPPTTIGTPSFDPPMPTLRLPRNFAPTRYTARLEIDPSKPDFAGEITIDGTLDRRSSSIWLSGKHLAVQAAHASNGSEQVPIAVTAKGDYLELRPAHALDAGAWQLALSYRGQFEQNGFDGAFLTKHASDAYVVTQFESTAARLVFPCLDEPDRKVPWQLTLDVPKGQLAFSNTPAITTTSLDAARDRIAFAPTRPLPSYLIAFAVGPWEIVDAGKAKSGLPIRIVVPRGEAKKAQYIASIEPKIVDFLEGWFAIPFPYPKLDVVVPPSLRGGAMENAGMITDDARGVLIEHPTQHQKFRMASTIGHETSHQWFGDLVTAAWWDDIWLNESFATWIEDKITSSLDSSWPAQALSRRYVFDEDELASARKIRQPIENEGDIHNAFDSITYPKGGLVLRMLEHQIGEAKFQAAIRGYIAAHADGNARAADVFAALDQANGSSLAAEMSSFFDQPGLPEIAMTLSCDGGTGKIAFAQQRMSSIGDTPAAETWTVPVCIAYEGATHERVDTCTVLSAPTAELAIDRCPAWIAPAGTYGYYRVKLEPKMVEAVRDRAWPMLTLDERDVIAADVWTAARGGRQPLPLALGLLAKLRASNSSRELAVGLGDFAMLGWAAGFPSGLAGAVPTELRDKARAKLRAIVEPIVRKLGLAPTRDEDFVSESLRGIALAGAEWSHSHVLDADAKRLVAHWRDLPVETQYAVLDLAANADPAVAEKLRVELDGETDVVLHARLLDVIAGLEDPKRHHAMLEKLVADPAVSSEDLPRVFWSGDVEAQRDSEDYIRAHWDELLKRMPTAENEDFPLVGQLLSTFYASCDPARRDDVVQFLTTHFEKLASLDRPTRQAIESYDRCLAHKRLLDAAVRAWLAK